MRTYGNGRLTSDEACRLVSDIIEGQAVLTPKPARSHVFAYHCHQLGLCFRKTRGVSSYCRAAKSLFRAVILGTRLLEQVPHRTQKLVPFLLRLCRFHEQWARSPDSWFLHPEDFDVTHASNVSVLLNSLIRHLFVRFEMPRHWDAVWYQEGAIDYAQLEWFVHVASGQSLRRARGLPLVLTKQATHAMTLAPDDLSLFEVMRWGQLRAMGADRELCRQLLKTRAAIDFANDSRLWEPLFRLMIRDPEFRPQMASALVEYLGMRQLGRADLEYYRFTRKTLRSLRREMAAFYREHPHAVWENHEVPVTRVLPQARKRRVYNWPGLRSVQGLDEVDSCSVRWCLFELRRSYLLESEGRHLGHCVADYINACREGNSSIWSLRSFRGEGQRWEATIEVYPKLRAIVQVEGYGNTRPSEEALAKIRSWAKWNRLRF